VTFPFSSPLSAVFSSARGFSRLKVIDCVRSAYKRAYRYASHVPYSTIDYTDALTQKSYYVTYPFGSLLCEKISYSENESKLWPFTDSFPISMKSRRPPFNTTICCSYLNALMDFVSAKASTRSSI
jgi:hypothetical protein